MFCKAGLLVASRSADVALGRRHRAVGLASRAHGCRHFLADTTVTLLDMVQQNSIIASRRLFDGVKWIPTPLLMETEREVRDDCDVLLDTNPVDTRRSRESDVLSINSSASAQKKSFLDSDVSVALE